MPCFKNFRLSGYAKPRNFKKSKKKKNRNVCRKTKVQKKRFDTTKYQDYLQSDYWKNVRQQVIEKQKCCVFCSSRTYLNVHHVRYHRHGKSFINNENLDNLYLLCRVCHEALHQLPSKIIIKQSVIDRVRRLIHIEKHTQLQAIQTLRCNT